VQHSARARALLLRLPGVVHSLHCSVLAALVAASVFWLGLLTAAAGVLRVFTGTPAPAFSASALWLLTRPHCALQEQAQKARVRGLEAQKQHIMAAKSVAKTLRSSLGPKGMDKMLQSGDGDVTISARPLRRAPATTTRAAPNRAASQPTTVQPSWSRWRLRTRLASCWWSCRAAKTPRSATAPRAWWCWQARC
jgi:hypothetical protein